MQQLTAPLAAGYNWPQVADLCRRRVPNARSVHVVEVDGADHAAVAVEDRDAPTDAAVKAWRDEVAALVPAEMPEKANHTAIIDNLGQAMAALQVIIEAPTVSVLNLAAARQLQDSVKVVARVQRRIIRLALADFAGSA